MKSVVALVDEDTGLGFRLSGIESRIVRNPDELRKEMSEGVKTGDVKVLIVDELLFRKLDKAEIHQAEQGTKPVVLPIPTIRLWEGLASPEEYVARLIQRAIGYQIKIKR